MRPVVALLLIALLAPALVHAEPDTVRFAELLPHPADGEREFIELWNPTDQDMDLTDWTITDAANTTFTFPQWHLPPGGRVVVWSGGDGDGRGPAWSRTSVWNNGGDTATLRDAQGTIIDTFSYGDEPAPPSQGQSLQWADGWLHADPTPGQAPGAQGGSATFHVQDVPPAITDVHAPDHAAPGDAFAIAFTVTDGNGDAVHWSVDGPDGIATGNGTGRHTIQVVAPLRDGAAVWVISADDGNATTAISVSVQVRASPLQVSLPVGGIMFPDLVPGATDVAAGAPLRITNLGNDTVTPRIDLSPFRGPGEVPVDGNLLLRLTDGVDVPYDGPLTPLPDLAAGQSVDVTMVIETVPVPLPAGSYGTTFAVVP